VYLAWSDPLWSGSAPAGAGVRRGPVVPDDQYRKPEFQVRFSGRPGSVAFWDNRAAGHYAMRNYGDFPRLLERILIADEPQYADL
jgi:hypothetical protein